MYMMMVSFLKDILLRIGKFLGVEAKTFNEMPNNGCNMVHI